MIKPEEGVMGPQTIASPLEVPVATWDLRLVSYVEAVL